VTVDIERMKLILLLAAITATSSAVVKEEISILKLVPQAKRYN